MKTAGLDRNILKNYRPVSNLSYISNLIEKAVARQINEHIAQEGISNENQSAHRVFHSTETALLKIQNDVAISMDKGAAVGLVLLDLSAAFDTIDLASHLCGRGSIPVMAVSGKAGSCLPLVGSLQYRTLANYMFWFPLPFQLPVVI